MHLTSQLCENLVQSREVNNFILSIFPSAPWTCALFRKPSINAATATNKLVETQTKLYLSLFWDWCDANFACKTLAKDFNKLMFTLDREYGVFDLLKLFLNKLFRSFELWFHLWFQLNTLILNMKVGLLALFFYFLKISFQGQICTSTASTCTAVNNLINKIIPYLPM